MIGAIVSGQIADYIGRRVGAWWLDLGRLLVGCGMGLLSYVLMTCCGVSLTYLIGAFVNWRTLALIGKLPCSCPELYHVEYNFM
ncbi:sugar transporter erd6-like 5, partial [Quercus suber]